MLSEPTRGRESPTLTTVRLHCGPPPPWYYGTSLVLWNHVPANYGTMVPLRKVRARMGSDGDSGEVREVQGKEVERLTEYYSPQFKQALWREIRTLEGLRAQIEAHEQGGAVEGASGAEMGREVDEILL